MKSRKEDIEAGKRHVERYMQSKAGKAAAKRYAPQLLEGTAELKTAFADFQPLRNEVDARLSALGFGPFADDHTMMITLCDVIGIDPNHAKAGELYRLARAWLEREKLKANIHKGVTSKAKPTRKNKTREQWNRLLEEFDRERSKNRKLSVATFAASKTIDANLMGKQFRTIRKDLRTAKSQIDAATAQRQRERE